MSALTSCILHTEKFLAGAGHDTEYVYELLETKNLGSLQ